MKRNLAEAIAEFASSFSYKELSGEAIKEAKRRIIDSIAVSIPTFNENVIKAIRSMFEGVKAEKAATIWGSMNKTSIDYASFVNSAMTRYFDYNDTYLSKEALHPSDCIAALIATAEARDIDGKELLNSIVLAYEIICKLADAASIRERGWDHVSYIAIGTAVAMARLLNLDIEKIKQAINLTAANVITLRQTRIGELSNWKGLSSPNAVRNAAFYALLAEKGITGPSPVFEGERGFFKQVSGEFELDLKKSFKIIETSIKNYPVEYHSMSAAEAAIALHDEISNIDEIESIEIATFQVSYNIIVKDPEKWDPKTRETADHSLPFIVAKSLADGKMDLDSYLNLEDQRVKKLMKKMKIYVDEEIDKLYPNAVPVRIKIKLKNRFLEKEIIYPKGHYRNPLSDEELNSKFLKLVKPYLKNESEELLKMLWNIEKADIKEIIRKLIIK